GRQHREQQRRSRRGPWYATRSSGDDRRAGVCRQQRQDGRRGGGGAAEGEIRRHLARPSDVAVAARFFNALRRGLERLFGGIAHGRPGTVTIGASAAPVKAGAPSAVIINAAPNVNGNASVKLPKRGTARDSAPSAIWTTKANAIDGPATAIATATILVARAAANDVHAGALPNAPGGKRSKPRANAAIVMR